METVDFDPSLEYGGSSVTSSKWCAETLLMLKNDLVKKAKKIVPRHYMDKVKYVAQEVGIGRVAGAWIYRDSDFVPAEGAIFI
ncbi:MAG: hypothetical protein PVJ60_06835 [Phycisphaerales bacterium]|jgi:hypothetical protein